MVYKLKYNLGSFFRNLDTEIVFKLVDFKSGTYVLSDKNNTIVGESEFTLDYDYEMIPENEAFLYGF